MLHSLYLYRTFERKKENSSASNILPSTQQYNRSISATLLPAVAAFDKKPHIRQNIIFLKYKKKKRRRGHATYIQPSARHAHYYLFNFFPRTIKEWNLIPSTISAESYSNFCNYLLSRNF